MKKLLAIFLTLMISVCVFTACEPKNATKISGDIDTASNPIAQISAGTMHTIILNSDGTVTAVGSNDHGQCNVTSWTDITQIATGGVYDNTYKTNILAAHTVGLKSDGTPIATGSNESGQCNVS